MVRQTLISFIWSPGNPLPAGTGGSENYTVGQVRELTRRGIPAQVVTVGLGTHDGRDDFPDVPFRSLPGLADVGIGVPYFIAAALGYGNGDVRAVTYEYGNAFLIVAGLLNLLVVIDAYDVAVGRK